MADANATVILPKVANALGMAPLIVADEEVTPNTPVVVDASIHELSPQEQDADVDFAVAREQLLDAIKIGGAVLSRSATVAKSLQTGAAFEGFASVLKELTDATQKLLALHDTRRQLVSTEESDAGHRDPIIGNAQNVIVVQNPAQLSQLMKGVRNHELAETGHRKLRHERDVPVSVPKVSGSDNGPVGDGG